MLSDKRRPRVLLAVSTGAQERMSRILAGYHLERPASLRELAFAMRCSAFDLAVVGSHFDSSRAIEALKTVLLNAPQVPLVCVRASPFDSTLGEATLAAFEAAAEEIGVDCYVDVLKFPDDAAGNARVRALFDRLLHVTPRGS